MKVIFIKDMAKVAQRGEVKDFADGYAINVLINKGYAIMATPAELQKLHQKQENQTKKKETAESLFLQLLQKISSKNILISGKKNDNGHLFAHVSTEDIADAIFSETKLSISPNQIHISEPIKKFGIYTVELKQGDKKGNIKVEIK